ncbi:cytochrome c biogenesis protein ResB [Herbiconiux sp. CPCC 205763]|uniref:Cytochrome c biogenesis protein ResB n=1 Tax=Herbiconiux aconitum TaxID=2970913 RepID=A0ABT2GP65_9MICO|nr:cytochrome c biogenesis protein ResB [Herbiconiux aconitum]MCS5717906.1 cytochrome c biogenesis protein ResB [Herbiconiux aconitum]
MSRPSDHFDSAEVTLPRLGFTGWLRWFWRQLTSMRTALFLLLLLALAAVPGSLVPQRAADPNGVTQYFVDNPDLAPFLDKLQAFNVYTSVWFSSIYLLLFISLIGCVIPRTKHHFDALRAQPPRTPARLSRLAGFTTRDIDGVAGGASVTPASVIESARALLKRQRYRTVVFTGVDARTGRETVSVSAERGYLRETGNLVFHSALVGILITVGIGGGFGYNGQRVVVEGQTFVNTLLAYDSFNPGRFFSDSQLSPYAITLDSFSASYETQSLKAFGQPLDYNAAVTTTDASGDTSDNDIKVNSPLKIGGTDVYLLGNGYAPTITIRNPAGDVVFTDSVPFLPQDSALTSLGVVKVPDGLPEQVGLIGFFYPTQAQADSGVYYSSFPDLQYPVLTLNVYDGDLGLDGGVPASVYTLDTDAMTQLTGGDTGVDSIELKPGETMDLPNGLGTVTLDGVKRFASFEVHHDPTQGWVLLFAVLVLGGLLTSLFIPRRRVWVKAASKADGAVHVEYAGLARGDDPRLVEAVAALAARHASGFPAASSADSSAGSSVDPSSTSAGSEDSSSAAVPPSSPTDPKA